MSPPKLVNTKTEIGNLYLNNQTSIQTSQNKTLRITKTFNTPISVKNKFLHYYLASKTKKYKDGNCK